MRKVITFIMTLSILIGCFHYVAKADDSQESVTVYITVSDITDYTRPLNVLVWRQPLEVSYFNLAEFGDTLNGIECVEGITYLHALTQLHRNLYGDENVDDNLLLTTSGVTKIFMGRSVANVMYKNGKDIFALPQLINIKDGDEIQVCLYDEGHSQAIATFNEARIDNVSPNELISLKLQQHYSFPRDKDAISGAEITDNNGVYLTDKKGNIITTKKDGSFDVSFPESGTYTISAMPEVNYYMLDTGGGIKVEWVPTTVIKEVEYTYTGYDMTYPDDNGYSEEENEKAAKALWQLGTDENNEEFGAVVLFEWDTGEVAFSGVPLEKVGTRFDEVTELVRVETVIPDELKPMVTYTTPFVTVNVTTDLLIKNMYLINDINLKLILKNSDYHKTDDIFVAGYTFTQDGYEKFEEVKSFRTLDSEYNLTFNKKYDIYKVFCWVDGTMTPLIDAYTYNPNEEQVQAVAEYDYTRQKPENTYTTAQ